MSRAQKIRDALMRLKEEFAYLLHEAPDEDLLAVQSHLAGPYHGIGDVKTQTGYGTEAIGQRLENLARRGPRAPDDLVVYRGTKEMPRKSARHERYPLTTTYEKSTAHSYLEGWDGMHDEGVTPLLQEIFVPRGSPLLMFDEGALQNRGIDMPYGDEEEILLPHRPGVLQQLKERITNDVLDGDDYPQRTINRWYRYRKPFRRGGSARV